MDSTSTAPAAAAKPTGDSISSHLQALADDAEALLKATARASDDKVHSARERLSGELAHLRQRLGELEGDAAARLKSAAHRTDQAVHAHPYVGMGAAAAIGLLLGFVLGRR
jgi:ElaB/YqjD/DUF883 family membrane-anchored ribosome-binding protein